MDITPVTVRSAATPPAAPAALVRVAERVVVLQQQQRGLLDQRADAVKKGQLERRVSVTRKLDDLEPKLERSRDRLLTQLGPAIKKEYEPLKTAIAEKTAARTNVMLQVLKRRMDDRPTARLEDTAARLGEELSGLRARLDTLTARALRRLPVSAR